MWRGKGLGGTGKSAARHKIFGKNMANGISFGMQKARMHRESGCARAFSMQKLVHYSDIVNGNGIWYGNHTIFERLKYTLFRTFCFLSFSMYGSAAGRRIFHWNRKRRKDWN